jgi:YidC/Oxa1 family membrane protein insertase
VADDKIIRRNFKLFGNNYRSKVEIEIENLGNELSGTDYDFQWTNGLAFVEKNAVDEANYSDAVVYSGEEHVKIDASSVDEVEKKDFNGSVDWIGIKSKYFGIIICPEDDLSDGGAFVEGRKIDQKELGPKEFYTAGYRVPLKHTNYQKNVFDLYMGPLDYDILKSYNKHYDVLFDFGSFMGMSFLIRPISEYILLPLFKFLHLFIPNYGFVIIVFSLIIKIALYPLTQKSFKSMKKMQQLQPKIAELKEKYKDEQQRVSQETMKLYSTYGINPAGGCLPMLLQMPILVALWSLFNVAIELRNQPFLFWIDNLSAPDVILRLPAGFPLISHLSGLALLMGITMFLQQKMTMKDPSQKALVYMMPVMLTIMFMNLPAGVNLYYFMFNLLSIIQQYYINNSKNDVELVPVLKPKKAGFMQRMMQAAEQQQKNQQQTKKKRK